MTANCNIDTLQHLWLSQLYQEFLDICFSHGVQLSAPIFEISDSRKILGSWHPETTTMRLSRHLILNHSWSVTLQVLKHEMAHQLAAQMRTGSDFAHGEKFQQACEILGVLPMFRRPGAVLPEMVEMAEARSEISENGRKCFAKIEKLLALGRSANEHEAASAIQKAGELLEKYQLHGLGEKRVDRFTCLVIDRKRKRIDSYQRHICAILQEFFFVRIVLASLYDPLRAESYKTIELFGSRENVAIAEYCFDFLGNRLEMLWSQNRQRFQGTTRTEKNSYYLGLLRGFQLKLREQKKGRQTVSLAKEVAALMVVEGRHLQEYVGMRYPRLRRAARNGAKVYGRTYSEGIETGRQITLVAGVTGEKTTFGGLLPG